MEQYIIKQIEEFLEEHPEARPFVEAAWGLGFAAAIDYGLRLRIANDTPAPKNPFREEPQEVKAA